MVIHFTMREFFRNFAADRHILIDIAVIFLLTFLGPFGSYEELNIAERFVFWTVCVGGVALFMGGLIRMCLAHPRLSTLPRMVRIAIGAALGGLPGAGVVFFVALIIWPGVAEAFRFPMIWMQVTIIGFAIGLVRFYGWSRPDRSESPSETETGSPYPAGSDPHEDTAQTTFTTRFHRRLPPELGSDIVSLSMQDHYVETTTTQGTHMVLIRLSDAMAELDKLPGHQIHRSHWAAKAHMVDVSRDGSRFQLLLSDGRTLPVSRTYVEPLRALMSEKISAT